MKFLVYFLLLIQIIIVNIISSILVDHILNFFHKQVIHVFYYYIKNSMEISYIWKQCIFNSFMNKVVI